MLKRMLFCVLIIWIILVSSCADLFRHEEYTKAEITSIDYLSDTSVTVKIDVYKKSNQSACSFKLLVDTTSTSYPAYQSYYKSYKIYTISKTCDLDKKYEVIVSGLKKHVKYYYQLWSYGEFPLGDKETHHYTFIGSKRIYSI